MLIAKTMHGHGMYMSGPHTSAGAPCTTVQQQHQLHVLEHVNGEVHAPDVFSQFEIAKLLSRLLFPLS